MKNITFGKTGERVSQICLGAMLMGTAINQEDSFAILDHFLDTGGNFIDTANCYAWWMGQQYNGDESETILGQWMKSRRNRDQVFLATKVGARINNLKRLHDPDGDMLWDLIPEAYEYLSPKTIRKGVEDSLRRLQTDYIDLYYAHIDDRATPLEETLAALNQLVEEGKVRQIGCSNIRTWRMERARQISARKGWASYVAVQQQYSYLRTKSSVEIGDTDAELLDYLAANDDLMLLAYSPILKGIYNQKEKREAYYNWHLFDNKDSYIRLAALSELAKDFGVTNNNLVLAWLMHQPKVIPIIGFSKKEQYLENIESIKIQLTAEQMEFLNSASA
jgi:aryl-alcohol dehydrogenase-like predicted oxidoreductase